MTTVTKITAEAFGSGNSSQPLPLLRIGELNDLMPAILQAASDRD